MIKKLLPSLILFNVIFLNTISYAETLADIRNELNSLSQEISKLESAPITNPVVPLVGGGFGVVVNSSANSNIVTYKPLSVLGGVSYQSKLQTGRILGKGNIKDIAAAKSAQAAADLAAKKIASERALSSALKEIDEATNFIDQSYKEGDIDGALAAIALVEVAVSDVSKAIPSEFKSKIIKQGKEFSKSEMDKILSMTKKIDQNKNLALLDLSENVNELTGKDFNVKKISDTVLKAGVKNSRIEEVYTKFTTDTLKNSLSETLKYKDIIGDTPSKVKNSVRQYEALQSGDPKQLRAFEMEKFGKAAGLNDDEIKKGIDAIYNGNIEVEKNISKNIWQKLENNPNFNVQNFSESELDKIMDEAVASEKATKAIKESGIEFGRNSKEEDLLKLANDVQNILKGKVDNSKIERIKQNIIYSKNARIDQKGLSASVIATINGSEYEDALLKSSSGSIAFRAAVVEAALNNNLGALNNVKDNNLADNMTLEQLNQLGTVYRDLIEPEQRRAAIETEKYNIMSAYGQSLKKEYEFAKENWYMNHVAKGDNLSPEATKAFKRMNELQLQTISISMQYEDIPKEFVDNYKNMEVTSIEALKLTQDSVIASKNLSDLKIQEHETSNDLEKLKSQINSTSQASLNEKKQELEMKLSSINSAINSAEINAKNAADAAKEATNAAVELASTKVVGKEIKEVTKEQLQRAYLRSHNAFAKGMIASGKYYFDDVSKTVKSTFNAEEAKIANEASVLASAEWQALKSLASTQNPIAANQAMVEIQKAIDEGSVDAIDAIAVMDAAVEAAKKGNTSLGKAKIVEELTETAELAKAFSDGKKIEADILKSAEESAKEVASKAAKQASEAAKIAADKVASNAADAAKAAADAAAKQAAADAAAAAQQAATEAASAAQQAAENAAKEAAEVAAKQASAAAQQAAKQAEEAAASAKSFVGLKSASKEAVEAAKAAKAATAEAAAAAQQAAAEAAVAAKEAATKAAAEIAAEAKKAADQAQAEAKKAALDKQWRESLADMNKAAKEGNWKAYNEAGKRHGAAIKGELMD